MELHTIIQPQDCKKEETCLVESSNFYDGILARASEIVDGLTPAEQKQVKSIMSSVICFRCGKCIRTRVDINRPPLNFFDD